MLTFAFTSPHVHLSDLGLRETGDHILGRLGVSCPYFPLWKR